MVEKIILPRKITYSTLPRDISLFSKLFPTLSFYYGVYNTIWRKAKIGKSGNWNDDCFRDCSRGVLASVEKAGGKVVVYGHDIFLKMEEPCVIAANHMSSLETFLIAMFVTEKRMATYVLKKSLIDYPVFKHALRNINAIAVGRVNAREDYETVISEGCKRLEAGLSVILFPQSSRDVNFEPSKFNSIGVKLAKKAGVPIVPCALKTDFWGNSKINMLKDFGKIDTKKVVRFAFGEPLMIENNGKAEQKLITAFIQEQLNEWKEEDRYA